MIASEIAVDLNSLMIAPSEGDKIKKLTQIKYDIEDACAKGSKLYYNLLNNNNLLNNKIETNENRRNDNIKRGPL
jgi:hypothetical protein